MILFPPAKINLGLKVLGKRPDGYHSIETCMIAVPFTDILEILPAERFQFVQTGLKVDGDVNDNLCSKAFHLLQEKYDLKGAYIHLRKNIPMGAGLGGGSADGTFVLRGLNDLFSLGLTNDELRNFATQLGSDCPFFVEDAPQMAKGRGEELESAEVDLSGYYIKLINPGIHIGTAEAYAGVSFSSEEISIASIIQQPMETWKDQLTNDFEQSIFEKYPEIESIKEMLYTEGAVYASMTGSGSTVYGIFSKEPDKSPVKHFQQIARF